MGRGKREDRGERTQRRAPKAKKTTDEKPASRGLLTRLSAFIKGVGAKVAGLFAGLRRRDHEVDDGSHAGKVWLSRERFLLSVLGLVSAVVVGRLFQIQIIQHKAYNEERQRRHTADITLIASRGTIYDRNGSVLATSASAKQIVLNAHNVKEDERDVVARRLALVLGGTEAEYQGYLAKTDSQYRLLARQVDPEVAQALADITGIEITEDPKRVYPNGQIAGQVIGVANMEGEGLTGLELKYNDILRGENGQILVERGRNGQPISGGVRQETPAKNGHDIVISIDVDLQQYVEARLAEAIEEWGPKSASVAVLDCETGEIYAIASTPLLDPTDFSKADPAAFQLKPVSEAYEPGSTFKCVTAAALLEEGAVTADTVIDIGSSIDIDEYEISDSHEHGDIKLTFREVISESSNIGTVNASQLIERKTLVSYIDRFGFGHNPGVDYPGVATGIVPSIENWNAATAANVPFGQGIACSTLQLVRAVAAIAQGGTMVTPHFLVDQPDDDTYEGDWPTSQIISNSTCYALTDILQTVVNEGTGTSAAIDGYAVAGKTGTAQKVVNGKYSKQAYVMSFVGWLPNSDCNLVCVVVLDEPEGGNGGGLVAGPIFKDIMTFVCDRYRVTPDLDLLAAAAPAAEGDAEQE